MHILWHKANMRITQKKGGKHAHAKIPFNDWMSKHFFKWKGDKPKTFFFWTKRQELCSSIKTIENYLQEILAQQDAKGLTKANQPTRRGWAQTQHTTNKPKT